MFAAVNQINITVDLRSLIYNLLVKRAHLFQIT